MTHHIAKKELRKLIKSNLHKTSAAEITAQSRNVFNILKSLPEYQAAKSIACYLHMDEHEIETNFITDDAFKQGKLVYLPRIVDLPEKHHGVLFKSHKKELNMLQVTSPEDILSLVPHGPYKLREPPLESPDALSLQGLDIIVVPGLGFTKRCHRIGHGKGFYDTYISKYTKWCAENNKVKPFLVGIGAKEQLVESIPQEDHDHPLDVVIIDDQLFKKE
ncbi:uncharacterized protein SAPINGB_P003230 [Magnusiomyces paraingens]|uniref:5-formyltetrahydrofolate cyclo-ligase n=1 Tax=Magnusiomyces paraingens TaxID=2606893 RepID=A0A5E8BLN6_9ASCO|nr:uncharacterized protein SAPINGB_P003230 [Saprochaete ingens]VVT51839.1 unnamed protein product [Saprochaete ingens]